MDASRGKQGVDSTLIDVDQESAASLEDNAQHNSIAEFPKDPAVLKRHCSNKFSMHSKLTIVTVIFYRDPFARTSFSLVLPAPLLSEKGSKHSKYGGGG